MAGGRLTTAPKSHAPNSSRAASRDARLPKRPATTSHATATASPAHGHDFAVAASGRVSRVIRQRSSDRVQQYLDSVRLLDARGRPLRPFEESPIQSRSEENDGTEITDTHELRADIDPSTVWQLEIEHTQIEVPATRQRRCAALGLHDVVADPLQEATQRVCKVRIILEHENTSGHFPAGSVDPRVLDH
jgi:hypothetical protein